MNNQKLNCKNVIQKRTGQELKHTKVQNISQIHFYADFTIVPL